MHHANGVVWEAVSPAVDDPPPTTTPTRLYTTGDTIAGAITLTTPPGSKVDHLGVKVEVLGQIEMGFDRG